MIRKTLLRELGNVFGKTRLITGRRVLMNKALVHRLVYKRDRRIQEFTALLLVGCRQCRPKLFDLGSQLTPVAPVNFVALRILPNAFFC